ncbi:MULTISPECIES: NAD(P)H-binding protein [unclassified Microbacterium]|uniref:NAD(P)H-binding protein n=1 Tax=unclassified Microbacterium TaxID=2609290 RepID=UPI00214CEF00|nr:MULTISPECIES: NAD(P)H-binding protein [unclassified Microbacterium]MCR2783282.1 NAD(P)H-binding protein [Microbacterium sp. zg.B96]WIM15843.1 NAD(P)H-binding protein [Microbacterium sp. zg-B96]
MKVLITGASGHLGRAVAGLLLERLAPADVVLGTRSPDALTDFMARGAEVRELDLDRPETLPGAFLGVDRVLLISTDALGRRGVQHQAAIDAATRAGATFIAYTSFPVLGSGDVISADHAATEQSLKDGPLEWCILRNFPYAEGETRALAEAVARGELVSNTGAGRTAFVSRADCAAVAAAVLTTSGHAGQVYDVTGPAALDAQDRARLFSEVSSRPVPVRHVDDETLARELAAAGGAPFPVALAMVSGIGGATREGAFATVSGVVSRLTGREATPLRTVLVSAQAAG